MTFGELRTRQRKLFEELLFPLPRAHCCVLPSSREITATLLRSAARLAFRGNERVYFADTLDDGYAWISSRVGVPAAEVRGAVDHVREVARHTE